MAQLELLTEQLDGKGKSDWSETGMMVSNTQGGMKPENVGQSFWDPKHPVTSPNKNGGP